MCALEVKLAPETEEERRYLAYAARYGKSPTSASDLAMRSALLSKSAADVERLNQGAKSATFATNAFSDWTEEEKSTLHQKVSPKLKAVHDTEAGDDAGSPKAGSPSSTTEAIDWRNYNGVNYISPVKNQRMTGETCTSGWAFATIAAVEAEFRYHGYYQFSE